jgi:hypothetical protein
VAQVENIEAIEAVENTKQKRLSGRSANKKNLEFMIERYGSRWQ